MVRGHIRALKQHKIYGQAMLVIFIEANMSYISADWIADCIRQETANIWVESRDPTSRNRVGVWTLNFEKEAYAWTLRSILENDNLYFADQMIGEHLQKDKDQLESQFRQFRMERREPADPGFDKFCYAYTGKTSGGSKDDLLLGLMIATYWDKRKREEADFIEMCQSRGFRL